MCRKVGRIDDAGIEELVCDEIKRQELEFHTGRVAQGEEGVGSDFVEASLPEASRQGAAEGKICSP